MLPKATRLANSAIAATIAVFDRRMIRISDASCLPRSNGPSHARKQLLLSKIEIILLYNLFSPGRRAEGMTNAGDTTPCHSSQRGSYRELASRSPAAVFGRRFFTLDP